MICFDPILAALYGVPAAVLIVAVLLLPYARAKTVPSQEPSK